MPETPSEIELAQLRAELPKVGSRGRPLPLVEAILAVHQAFGDVPPDEVRRLMDKKCPDCHRFTLTRRAPRRGTGRVRLGCTHPGCGFADEFPDPKQECCSHQQSNLPSARAGERIQA